MVAKSDAIGDRLLQIEHNLVRGRAYLMDTFGYEAWVRDLAAMFHILKHRVETLRLMRRSNRLDSLFFSGVEPWAGFGREYSQEEERDDS